MKTKLFCFLLVLSLLVSFSSFAITANEKNDFPDTDGARAVCVYNINTDRTIFKKNTDARIFPSGSVKMVTGLIACEMLSDRLEEEVLITEQMLEGASGATVRLRSGMTVTVENLLYGVLCGGGNDASTVLATLCDGSTEAFVNRMNIKATEWGLKNTIFTNPTGIDDKNMYSTLDDIMIIARLAYQNQLYMEISSKASYEFTPIGASDSIYFSNRNRLINSYDCKNPYAEGLCTGNTDLGGCSVITSASCEDTKYICAVMGADEDSYYQIANDLIYHALNNYFYVKVTNAGQYICSINTKFSMPSADKEQGMVDCVIIDDVYALTDRKTDLQNDITYRYYLHKDTWDAPIEKGLIVGSVDILRDGVIIARAKLVTAEEMPASRLLLFLNNMKKFFISRLFILSVLFFGILFGVYWRIIRYRIRHHRVKKLDFDRRKK